MSGIPVLRTRHYFFIVAVTTIIFHIGAFVYGGWGWFWMGWLVSGFFLVGWGFSNLARIASSKIIWYGGSASLGPTPLLATLPAIYDRDESKKDAPAQLIHPESQCFALGGARLGGINIGETGEYLICRKGLAIATAPIGMTIPNYFINGYARELSRDQHVKYRLWSDVKPHLLDPRSHIPQQWLDIITQHPKWSWRDSKIWIVDLAVHPQIQLDAAGNFEFHAADGADPVRLRAFFPTIDRFDPGMVLLDLVHEVDERSAAEIRAAREKNARLMGAAKTEGDHYTGIIARMVDTESKVVQGGLIGYVQDMASPQGDASEGVSRQQ